MYLGGLRNIGALKKNAQNSLTHTWARTLLGPHTAKLGPFIIVIYSIAQLSLVCINNFLTAFAEELICVDSCMCWGFFFQLLQLHYTLMDAPPIKKQRRRRPSRSNATYPTLFLPDELMFIYVVSTILVYAYTLIFEHRYRYLV